MRPTRTAPVLAKAQEGAQETRRPGEPSSEAWRAGAALGEGGQKGEGSGLRPVLLEETGESTGVWAPCLCPETPLSCRPPCGPPPPGQEQGSSKFAGFLTHSSALVG